MKTLIPLFLIAYFCVPQAYAKVDTSSPPFMSALRARAGCATAWADYRALRDEFRDRTRKEFPVYGPTTPAQHVANTSNVADLSGLFTLLGRYQWAMEVRFRLRDIRSRIDDFCPLV